MKQLKKVQNGAVFVMPLPSGKFAYGVISNDIPDYVMVNIYHYVSESDGHYEEAMTSPIFLWDYQMLTDGSFRKAFFKDNPTKVARISKYVDSSQKSKLRNKYLLRGGPYMNWIGEPTLVDLRRNEPDRIIGLEEYEYYYKSGCQLHGCNFPQGDIIVIEEMLLQYRKTRHDQHLCHMTTEELQAVYNKYENEYTLEEQRGFKNMWLNDNDTKTKMLWVFKKIEIDTKEEPYYLTVSINARLQPMHRAERYEDPLDEMLSQKNLGEVSGGGSYQSDSGEIERCDVQIILFQFSDAVLVYIKRVLENIGIPKGSEIQLPNRDEVTHLGNLEGLAIYLNGTDLDQCVYEEWDVNFVYSELGRLIEGKGVVYSFWQGPIESAFYLYGPSFSEMECLISDLIENYPLCKKSRIEKIA